MISGSYLKDIYLDKSYTEEQGDSLDFTTNKWFSYTSTTETIRTWPKVISSLSDIPSYFKDFFYIESNTFPYTILIPEDIVFVRSRAKRTNTKLLSLYKEKIIVLEKSKRGIIEQYHNFYGINYFKIESILLYSGIKISSNNAVSHIHFNSIRDDFFKLIKEKIRKYYLKTNDKKIIKLNFEEKLSEYYTKGKINYKFMNYGIESLLPGQKIKKFIYQEPLKINKFKNGFFNWLKNYTTPMLLLLNGEELIIIEEPVKMKKDKDIEYGVVFTYIPFEKIEKITFNKRDYIEMNIELLNKEVINLYFSNDKDKDIEDFKNIYN